MAAVLVVDDDPVIRRLIEVNLEMEGYEVIHAEDGAAALQALTQRTVDLVILDVMMPNIDGWDVRRRMLDDPELAEIPTIFLSARAQEADRRRGEELGATPYVTKPFDPIDLMELVAELIAG